VGLRIAAVGNCLELAFHTYFSSRGAPARHGTIVFGMSFDQGFCRSAESAGKIASYDKSYNAGV